MLLNFIAVFIGGGIGCSLRFAANNVYAKFIGNNLFYSTLAVNFIGSFILGIAFVFFTEKTSFHPAAKYAVTVGFCGGLTTFSTFSLELFEMIKSGNYLLALSYGIASVTVCVVAIAVGVAIAKPYL